MRRPQIGSKKAAREHERLKREIAEKRAEARRESEDRKKGIKASWDLDEQQLSAAKNPRERKLKEQELKAKKLKELVQSVRDSTGNDDLVDRVSELIELVGLQDREIEYLTQFRREWEQIQAYYPDLLESLSFQSLLAQLRPPTDKLLAEEMPKKAWERKRGGYRWAGAGVGLIEYEFGGRAEAELRKRMLRFPSALGPYAPAYRPRCLDNILSGGVGELKMMPSFFGQPPIAVDTRTNMRRLQDLFGVHRNRFPKKLPPHSVGREILYDYRAVVEIMKALLKPSACTRLARGAPRRLWLSGPALRARVLSGIEARLKSISAPEHIKAAFLPVVRVTCPIRLKNRLAEPTATDF